MVNDDIAANEITRQIAALKPRIEGSRGVMGYLDKPQNDKRADVNKTFLATTIRSIDSHNRRQEENKCWTLRRMEHKLDEGSNWQRSSLRSNIYRSDEKKRKGSVRRSRSRSRSRSHLRQSRRSRSRNRRRCSRGQSERKDEDKRSYWARKKADKTQKIWKVLQSKGTISVENAPDIDSDDDDIKPDRNLSITSLNCKECSK
ncbi:uncharacterized protein PHALS_12695 [Plasmopara halstedii]|uniref:Uncharacterized protein n=1 Tax=Plasmopara halstedii TaxID=4781 RepID=A0A0P1ANQ4_PLAHL|nr:uncharacterized protein PHALS_12695 [Plasmopara halstedii]CEG42417.1 hypothetical protein PHALS_12695 [Plasmopara halstedii]|eukprot:XP_024578786.1 hypothetical protein PHALS_12695 [Plasmopara halstedii]